MLTGNSIKITGSQCLFVFIFFMRWEEGIGLKWSPDSVPFILVLYCHSYRLITIINCNTYEDQIFQRHLFKRLRLDCVRFAVKTTIQPMRLQQKPSYMLTISYLLYSNSVRFLWPSKALVLWKLLLLLLKYSALLFYFHVQPIDYTVTMLLSIMANQHNSWQRLEKYT